MWDLDLHLAFHGPLVNQFRNAHDYLSDFNAEKPLYETSASLIKSLASLQFITRTLPGRIEELVVAMFEFGVLNIDDVRLTQAFVSDLLAIGYSFPTLRRSGSVSYKTQSLQISPRDTAAVITEAATKALTTMRPTVPAMTQPKPVTTVTSAAAAHTVQSTPSTAAATLPVTVSATLAPTVVASVATTRVTSSTQSILDVTSAASANVSAATKNATFGLVIRTYSKEPNPRSLYGLKMFADPTIFHTVAVLDNESAAEHSFGVHLETQDGFSVRYRDAPEKEMLQCTGRNLGKKSPQDEGYCRQLYDTFFFDQFSDEDIIGIVDSDSCFNFLLPDTILVDGKIVVHVAKGVDAWPGDASWFKWRHTDRRMANMMWFDSFPQFFWRSTFVAFRKWVETQHKMPFDKIWKMFKIGKVISPVNIIATFAKNFEGHKYTIVEQNRDNHGQPSDVGGLVVLGSHGKNGFCHDNTFELGECCSVFGVRCAEARIVEGVQNPKYVGQLPLAIMKPLLQRYNHSRGRPVYSSKYAKARDHVAKMDPKVKSTMLAACNAFNISVIKFRK